MTEQKYKSKMATELLSLRKNGGKKAPEKKRFTWERSLALPSQLVQSPGLTQPADSNETPEAQRKAADENYLKNRTHSRFDLKKLRKEVESNKEEP